MFKRVLLIIGLIVLFPLIGVVVFAFNALVVTERTVDFAELQPQLDVTSVEVWEAERTHLLSILEKEQYGVVPTTTVDWNVQKKVLDANVRSGTASYELWTLSAPESEFILNIVGLFPKSDAALPMVVASNFCPHHVRYPGYDIPVPEHFSEMCESEGVLSDLMGNVFGEFLTSYPEDQFIENEVILANVFLAEGVADDPIHYEVGLQQVADITNTNVDGVLAAWAWTFGEVTRVFEADDRVDPSRTAVYGHSRDGKAALLAGAFNQNIDLVLSHQSGKGGAAPWQRKVGESVEAVTDTYGFWFTPDFVQFAGNDTAISVDQHALIAAVAPRPVLLSVAWMDKWGDPAGTRVSAQNATPVYELYGARGISNGVLSDFDPELELSYFIRPWTHGVRASDWDAFFMFMNEHFAEESE